MQSFTTWESELYHHGILGMKWGVRRYQNEDGSLTAAGVRRRARLERLEAKENAKTERKKAKIENRHISLRKMSNAELEKRISRLRMEKQYRDLRKDTSVLSSGMKFIEKMTEASKAKDEANLKRLEQYTKWAIARNDRKKAKYENNVDALHQKFKKEKQIAEQAKANAKKEKYSAKKEKRNRLSKLIGSIMANKKTNAAIKTINKMPLSEQKAFVASLLGTAEKREVKVNRTENVVLNGQSNNSPYSALDAIGFSYRKN